MARNKNRNQRNIHRQRNKRDKNRSKIRGRSNSKNQKRIRQNQHQIRNLRTYPNILPHPKTKHRRQQRNTTRKITLPEPPHKINRQREQVKNQ